MNSCPRSTRNMCKMVNRLDVRGTPTNGERRGDERTLGSRHQKRKNVTKSLLLRFRNRLFSIETLGYGEEEEAEDEEKRKEGRDDEQARMSEAKPISSALSTWRSSVRRSASPATPRLGSLPKRCVFLYEKRVLRADLAELLVKLSELQEAVLLGPLLLEIAEHFPVTRFGRRPGGFQVHLHFLLDWILSHHRPRLLVDPDCTALAIESHEPLRLLPLLVLDVLAHPGRVLG